MKKLLLFILCPMFLFGQTQVGNDIIGEVDRDHFGWSVSLSSDGSILAVGANNHNSATGQVKIYKLNNNSWLQIGSDILGEKKFDYLGGSVKLSSEGNIVAIGAHGGLGYVSLYKNINDEWHQIGNKIIGEASGLYSGWALSLSSEGNIVAIGAYGNRDNGSGSGHVRVFRNNNDVWEQIGSDIDGEAAGDWSGYSVSLSSNGNILAIGAYKNNGNGGGSGHVRVFRNNNDVWEQIGSDINGEQRNDHFGFSVSLSADGNILAASGNLNSDLGQNSGHVRVFRNNNDIWEQIGSSISGESTNDYSGRSVNLNSEGNVVSISSDFNSGNGLESGHVRIFENIDNNWVQIGSDIDGKKQGEHFGVSTSLNSKGNFIAIGAIEQNEGLVRVYDLSAILSSDSFLLSKFNIYPNPVNNKVTVVLKDDLEVVNISIYNNLGQFIKSSKELTIDISSLSKGIYFLQLETNQGKASKKLVIE